ncbi:MAG TPA: YopX family protein [bacterium]|nr:YopX family protein [bacterium]
MTREIKFRAWDRELNIMMPVSGLSFEASISAKYEIMQFTGLYDKNGREIYEGDIVRQTGGYRMQQYAVEYRDAGYNLPLIENYNDGRVSDTWKLTYEIIGNIYENPKLMAEVQR